MNTLRLLKSVLVTTLFLIVACSNAGTNVPLPVPERSAHIAVGAAPADTGPYPTSGISSTPIEPTHTTFPAYTATAVPTVGQLPASPTVIPETPTEILTPTPTTTPEPTGFDWRQASQFEGQEVTICGPVVGTHYASSSNGRPTFLNIGEDYPSPNRFTVLIWGHDRDNFLQKPEEIYAGLSICVHGRVEIYEGVAEIEVESPGQISTSGSG